MRKDLPDKIKAYSVVVPSGCWEWQRSLDRDGYGVCSYRGKKNSAHRVAYISFRGEIPEGYHIDHLCRNHRCCNPSHLEAVTHRENCLRGIGIGALNAAKTHCHHGHPFDAKNTYRYGGSHRQCRACNHMAVRRYKSRRRAQARNIPPARQVLQSMVSA